MARWPQFIDRLFISSANLAYRHVHPFHNCRSRPAAAHSLVHVPVWYRWGEAERRSTDQDPQLALFAPTPEQLQMGTTILVRDPPSLPQPDPYTKKYVGQPWKAFFSRRDASNARLIAQEMPINRQQRYDRSLNPP